MRFCCIAGTLEHPIVGAQHHSVWPGLEAAGGMSKTERVLRLSGSVRDRILPRTAR